MRFSKFLATTGLAVSLASPLSAGSATQLQKQVADILPQYGYTGVDVSELNSAQLAQIRHLAASNKGQGDIRGQIGAVLGNSIIKFLRG